MTTHLSGFASEAGRAAYLAAYDRVLADLWPVSTESILIETGFGTTHAIALLAPAGTIRPMRLRVLLLSRLRLFLPKKEPLAETRKTFRTVFGGRYMPDERYVAQVALGARHFRYQKPPIFPTVFPDEDLRRIAVPAGAGQDHPHLRDLPALRLLPARPPDA